MSADPYRSSEGVQEAVERHRITEEEETKRQRNREREETKRAEIADRSASPAWFLAQVVKLAALIAVCTTVYYLNELRSGRARSAACADSVQTTRGPGYDPVACLNGATGRLEGDKLVCTCPKAAAVEASASAPAPSAK